MKVTSIPLYLWYGTECGFIDRFALLREHLPVCNDPKHQEYLAKYDTVRYKNVII